MAAAEAASGSGDDGGTTIKSDIHELLSVA
jgi:hypothetical protein